MFLLMLYKILYDNKKMYSLRIIKSQKLMKTACITSCPLPYDVNPIHLLRYSSINITWEMPLEMSQSFPVDVFVNIYIYRYVLLLELSG